MDLQMRRRRWNDRCTVSEGWGSGMGEMRVPEGECAKGVCERMLEREEVGKGGTSDDERSVLMRRPLPCPCED
jgi:hypothetical protein